MHSRRLILNTMIVNEGQCRKGHVLIDDDRIERLVFGEAPRDLIDVAGVIDGEGSWLLPGVIDTHVHFRDPGLTYKADMESESRAAAMGGVTTWLDMPNTVPQTTTREAFSEKMALAARKSRVNYGFFFGATTDNVDVLPKLNRRKVAGVKLFMGASTGNMLVDDEAALRAVFENCRLPIVAHCEDSAVIARRMAEARERYGDDPDVCHHPEIRSAEACYASTVKAVALATETGARLHVAHITTERELGLFSAGDTHITAEACVPHLLFTDADYARLGTRIKCNPAVKTAADRAALRRALSEGIISSIATDHAPHALTDKVGGAARAASGMPMVQFSLVAMLDLVDEGVLSIERLVELMCHAPARLFNIENRGFLREGYKADLVMVRRDHPWTLTPNRIASRCNWSPLEGHTFKWRVARTFCNGFQIYNGHRLTDESFRGEAVTFDR